MDINNITYLGILTERMGIKLVYYNKTSNNLITGLVTYQNKFYALLLSYAISVCTACVNIQPLVKGMVFLILI